MQLLFSGRYLHCHSLNDSVSLEDSQWKVSRRNKIFSYQLHQQLQVQRHKNKSCCCFITL